MQQNSLPAPNIVKVPGKVGLARLMQFLIELSQRKAWCTLTLTIQKGQIEMVHVDHSYKLDELPVRDSQA